MGTPSAATADLSGSSFLMVSLVTNADTWSVFSLVIDIFSADAVEEANATSWGFVDGLYKDRRTTADTR